LPQNVPNGHKIDQMDICKIDQQLPLQVPPKFTQNMDFGFETTMSSGNPDGQSRDPGNPIWQTNGSSTQLLRNRTQLPA
jgi:hypothetical protein